MVAPGVRTRKAAALASAGEVVAPAFVLGSGGKAADAAGMVFGAAWGMVVADESLAQYLPMPTVPGGGAQFSADAAMQNDVLSMTSK